MNILVRGGGFSNKGAEAMALTVKEELGRRLSGACFFIEVPPAQASLAEAAGFCPVMGTSGQRIQKAARLAWMSVRHPRMAALAFKLPRMALRLVEVDRMDGIVDVSGFAYGDDWGEGNARTTWFFVDHMERSGRPYILLPQAWGPFVKKPVVADYTRKFCLKASMVYARDGQSRGYLAELLGERRARIRTAPDIAFRFHGVQAEIGAGLIERAGIQRSDGPIVGITPNLHLYQRTRGQGGENDYIKAVGETVRHLHGLGAAVLLIPHEVPVGMAMQEDDRSLCERIKTAVGSRGPLGMIAEPTSAGGLKGVIHHLDLLIGSRYHSIIAALASGVPAVVLGWSHKYKELMRSFGQERYVVDQAHLDATSLILMVESAWREREAIRRTLADRLPAIQHAVDVVFDEVADLIRRTAQ